MRWRLKIIGGFVLKARPLDIQNIFVLFSTAEKIVPNNLANHGADTGRIPVREWVWRYSQICASLPLPALSLATDILIK